MDLRLKLLSDSITVDFDLDVDSADGLDWEVTKKIFYDNFMEAVDPMTYAEAFHDAFMWPMDHPKEAMLLVLLRKAPAKGLSNINVRTWYNKQLKTLDTSGPLTRETAMRVHNARNLLKQQGRDMMADRSAAGQLAKERPLRSFEHYVEKYTKQGFKGEALWKRIIEGGTTPNAAVNKRYGIK